MAKQALIETVKAKASDIKTYWKIPAPGRYMPFKEIASYSGGGIGAYMIVTLGSACILGTGNTLISSALGVDAMDMYIMHVIAVISNIFLTGIRANIIDNTRNKAGKYRPYIVSMAIPSALIALLMVYFPYEGFGTVLTNSRFSVKALPTFQSVQLFLFLTFSCTSSTISSMTALRTLSTFSHPIHRKEQTLHQSRALFTPSLPPSLTSSHPSSQEKFSTQTQPISVFTDSSGPSSLLPVSFFVSLFTEAHRKKSCRQRPTLSKSSLSMHSERLPRTSTSG